MKTQSLATLLIAVALSPFAVAKDHILTVGGGYSPAGNQVSLEKNVIFFRKLLAEKLPGGTPHDVYFADGDSPNHDLQFDPEEDTVPRANRLMAALFGSTKYIGLQYRDHQIDNVRGVSSPAELEAWFKDKGAKLADGDRLILYVTAHGGKSGHKDNKHNTKIYMWNGKNLEASKLAALLKELPEGVSVLMVMVQCYSGGFAHLIYDEANAKNPHAARNICGFFATVHDRQSAGCTPDINEEDYDEYSSHLWAALRGKTRMEKPVAAPDYDGDGRVSFDEAHAYTILTSKNIDVPLKTSDAFLRKHSKTKEKDKPDLLGAETPYFQLLAHARPVDLALLDGLSAQLELGGTGRGAAATKKAKEIAEQRKQLDKKEKETKKAYDTARNEIRNEIRSRWPDLANTLSPGAQELLVSNAPEFIKAIEGHPKYAEWNKLRKEREKMDDEDFALEKRWAKHKRFIRALENVALAANLESLADSETRSHYAALIAAEAGSLSEASKPKPAAPEASKSKPAAPQPVETKTAKNSG